MNTIFLYRTKKIDFQRYTWTFQNKFIYIVISLDYFIYIYDFGTFLHCKILIMLVWMLFCKKKDYEEYNALLVVVYHYNLNFRNIFYHRILFRFYFLVIISFQLFSKSHVKSFFLFIVFGFYFRLFQTICK